MRGRRIHIGRVIIAGALVAVISACGGGGGGGGGGGTTPPPPPTITSVTVTCPSSVTAGQSATCTATVQGTGSFSSAVTWTSSNTGVATVSSSGSVSGVTAGTTTITATSTEDTTKSGTASITVTASSTITSVSVTCPAQVTVGNNATCSAQVAGTGSFASTVTWASSNTADATVNSSGSVTGVAAGTANITATSTQDTSKSGSASINVVAARKITISMASPSVLPNQEAYFEYPSAFSTNFNCTGCVSTDTINEKDSTGNSVSTPLGSATSWSQSISPSGNSTTGFVQRLIQLSLSGTDGATSNTFYITYAGSQNAVVADSSGNYYYCCDVAVSSAASAPYSLKFPSGGGASSQINVAGPAIAIDTSANPNVLYFTEISGLTPKSNGIEELPVGSSSGTLIPLANGEPLAIDAGGGLVCVTIPSGFPTPNNTDAVDCHNSNGNFTAPVPSGSDPAAVKVIDGSDFVVYGRGDQTLRWFTVSGAAATATGTLQLSQFTAAGPQWFTKLPITGGWNIAMEGTTLAVLGQVAGASVTQELALVNNANKTLIQYVNLPAGTLRIAADSTNHAFVAAYPDFSGSSPLTRFLRISTGGTTTQLTSTSALVPAAGLVVTPDGSQIGVFLAGKSDFEPNR